MGLAEAAELLGMSYRETKRLLLISSRRNVCVRLRIIWCSTPAPPRVLTAGRDYANQLALLMD
jgi:hypothetical protein